MRMINHSSVEQSGKISNMSTKRWLPCSALRYFQVLLLMLHFLKSVKIYNYLWNSLSVPKLLYVLRTSACAGHPLLQTFDDILRSGLSDILNVSITDDQWIQASLPVWHGGLGVRSVVRLASSAFLASAAGSIPYLVQILPERVADPTRQSDRIYNRYVEIRQQLRTSNESWCTCSKILGWEGH